MAYDEARGRTVIVLNLTSATKRILGVGRPGLDQRHPG